MTIAVRTGAALIVLCAALVYLSSQTPAAVPATAAPAVFSAGRAMAHLRAIAQRPHPSGSADHARVRAYLVQQLAALGLDPQVQETTGIGTRYSVAAHIYNVIARLRGTASGAGAILIAAHYDSVGAAPGAGDDGAAVAALLETMRALRASAPLADDVIALFTDGEEGGLTGAAAFVREHPWARDVAVTLNFEGRGTRGPSIMFQTAAGNLDMARVLRRVPGAFANSLSVALYRLLPNDTDFSEFAALGQPGMNFAFTDGLELYHTSRDDPSALSAGSLEHHGEQMLAVTRALGDDPLPRPTTADAIFFTVPWLGLVLYPQGFAWPLVALAAVLVIVGCVGLRRVEGHYVRNLIVGALVTVVTTALGASLAFGASTLLERRLGAPAAGGWSAMRALYATAIALLALSPAIAVWALLRRWLVATGAQLGALLVWTIIAVAVTRVLPAGSYLFVWPVLAVSGAAIVRRPIVSWVATIVVAAVVVPPVYMTAVVVFGMARLGVLVIGVFVPITAWLLADRLNELSARRGWVMPLVTFATSLLLLGVCVAAAQPSADHPGSSMLGYAIDAGTSRAWLVTPANAARPGTWMAAALGPRAHVVVPGDASPDGWITGALGGDAPTLATEAPSIQVGAAELTVMQEHPTRDGRQIELRVRPAAGTYAMRIRTVDAAVRAAAVDGRALNMRLYGTASGQLTLGFVAPPSDGFVVTMTVAGVQPVELDIISRSLGLPAIAGMTIPPRPEGVVPIHTGDLTVVHQRARF